MRRATTPGQVTARGLRHHGRAPHLGGAYSLPPRARPGRTAHLDHAEKRWKERGVSPYPTRGAQNPGQARVPQAKGRASSVPDPFLTEKVAVSISAGRAAAASQPIMRHAATASTGSGDLRRPWCTCQLPRGAGTRDLRLRAGRRAPGPHGRLRAAQRQQQHTAEGGTGALDRATSLGDTPVRRNHWGARREAFVSGPARIAHP